MTEPAYTRLPVDQRRSQLLQAGAALFAEHAYEEISMREIAQVAGVSKALLFHYFPTKAELFTAAVQDQAAELEHLIEPDGDGTPIEQLQRSLDAYLRWIEDNARTWTKLMQSAAGLPEAHKAVETFRAQTLQRALSELTGENEPPPALRTALQGWLGYLDAAILDWTQNQDLHRDQLRDLLTAAFGAAVLAAQEIDPKVQVDGTDAGASARPQT